MVDVESISVSVCYALPEHQDIVDLRVAKTSTVLDAIEQSGILRNCPQIDLAKNKVGVHAKVVELNHILHEHDRVEIYRSLTIDPLQARRNRAAQQNG